MADAIDARVDEIIRALINVWSESAIQEQLSNKKFKSVWKDRENTAGEMTASDCKTVPLQNKETKNTVQKF